MRWVAGYLRALDRGRATGLAAELAFWVFLSLVPLAAVLGMVAARLAMSDVTLLRALTSSLPRASRTLVFDQVALLSARHGAAVGPVATIVFVWLGSSGIHAIFDALEAVSHARPRTWLRKRGLAMMACVVLSLATALIAVVGIGVSGLRQRLLPSAVASDPVWSTLGVLSTVPLVVGMIAALFAVASARTPHRPVRLLPGACVAVLAQISTGLVYAQLIAAMGDGVPYLAGLAVIGVTMTAMYLSALSLLIGATLNHYLVDRASAVVGASTRTRTRPPRRDARAGRVA